jgi:hypothetical protein
VESEESPEEADDVDDTDFNSTEFVGDLRFGCFLAEDDEEEVEEEEDGRLFVAKGVDGAVGVDVVVVGVEGVGLEPLAVVRILMLVPGTLWTSGSVVDELSVEVEELAGLAGLRGTSTKPASGLGLGLATMGRETPPSSFFWAGLGRVTGPSSAGLGFLTMPKVTGSSGAFLATVGSGTAGCLPLLLLLAPKRGSFTPTLWGRVRVRRALLLPRADSGLNMMKTAMVGGTSTQMMTMRRSRAVKPAPADWTISIRAWITKMTEQMDMITSNLLICSLCFVVSISAPCFILFLTAMARKVPRNKKQPAQQKQTNAKKLL